MGKFEILLLLNRVKIQNTNPPPLLSRDNITLRSQFMPTADPKSLLEDEESDNFLTAKINNYKDFTIAILNDTKACIQRNTRSIFSE